MELAANSVMPLQTLQHVVDIAEDTHRKQCIMMWRSMKVIANKYDLHPDAKSELDQLMRKSLVTPLGKINTRRSRDGYVEGLPTFVPFRDIDLPPAERQYKHVRRKGRMCTVWQKHPIMYTDIEKTLQVLLR